MGGTAVTDKRKTIILSLLKAFISTIPHKFTTRMLLKINKNLPLCLRFSSKLLIQVLLEQKPRNWKPNVSIEEMFPDNGLAEPCHSNDIVTI